MLEQIERRKLEDAGAEPLSPGTRRFRELLHQAFQDLERRLAEAAQVEPPF